MSTVIEFQKLKLATNLEWQSTDAKRKSIQKLGKEFNASFYAYYGDKKEGIQKQIGLFTGKDRLGHKHFSFAVLVLSQLKVNDALVVTQLKKDVYAIVVIDNGLITYDLCDTAEEVKKVYLNLAAYKKFSTKYAPAGWSSSDTQEFVLDLSLANKHKNIARMKPMKSSPLKVLLPLAIAGASVFAINAYLDYQSSLKQAAAIAEMKRLQANQKESPEPVTYPWNKSSSAIITWHACELLFMPLELYPAGWKAQKAGCNSDGLTVTFERLKFGNVAGLLESFPNANVDLSGNQAVLNIQHVTPLPKVGITLDDLPDANAYKTILSLSQSYQFTVNLIPTQSKTLPGQVPNTKEMFRQLKVTADSKYLPMGNVLELLNMASLVDPLFTTNDMETWNFQGILYVR